MSDCVRCVHNREGIDDPRVPIKTVTRRASDLLRASHGNSTLVVENFLTDGTVLVFGGAHINRGTGKGKRLIILVRAVILCHSCLLNLLTVGCCS